MSTIITLVYIALVIAIFYVVLKERRDPAETLACMLVILMLPAVGIIAYILFGRSWRKSKTFSYKDDTVSRNINEICEKQLHEISKENYSELMVKNFVVLDTKKIGPKGVASPRAITAFKHDK